ncbi:MAG TPA: YfbK domain-containing protein, partial [Candidatus Eisenbacteria bacterium]
ADIVRAIDWLRPEGSTNVQAGLREGYRMAYEAMRPGRVNRIILCSDGVANNGLTEGDAILDEVRREARRGIELTAVGFGMSNYNDVLMEKLADHGDGSYWYVDRLDEARRIFVQSLTGTLQSVARQAKVQVEFDPARVERYRLIGYENRDVADRDFRNDAVDAGEVGAGHEVTALFELKARDRKASVVAPDGTGALATVRIRYEDPDTRKVREVARSVFPADVLSEERSLPPSLALDAAVAEFAEVLRHSYWSRESTPGDALALARRAVGRLGKREDRLELIGMMETADRLWPGERRQGWRDDKPGGE